MRFGAPLGSNVGNGGIYEMKKALSLILALTLCLGLAVPALATERPNAWFPAYWIDSDKEVTEQIMDTWNNSPVMMWSFPADTTFSFDNSKATYFTVFIYKENSNGDGRELVCDLGASGDFALINGTRYCVETLNDGEWYDTQYVVAGRDSNDGSAPAESLETEDVYLLGDGTSTRMAPGVYWDAPFTGTSTETVFGKEVTVWHFPANAKIALDDWSYRVSMQVVSFSDEDGDGIKEEISYLSGDDIGTTPSTLGYADTVYIMEIYENGYDPDSDTYSSAFLKRYYIRLDEDPTVSAWAKEEISAARSAGLIPDLTGAPGMQDTITREQFAELIVNYLNVLRVYVPDGDTSFVDCDNPAVLMAASAGIVNGVGNNKFDPNTTTNREQIATMIYRAIKYVESLRDQNPATKEGSIAKYTDKSAVSDWAVEGVGVLAANGIMKGTSDTTLSPKNPCTVEQSIILIYRLFEAYFAD